MNAPSPITTSAPRVYLAQAAADDADTLALFATRWFERLEEAS